MWLQLIHSTKTKARSTIKNTSVVHNFKNHGNYPLSQNPPLPSPRKKNIWRIERLFLGVYFWKIWVNQEIFPFLGVIFSGFELPPSSLHPQADSKRKLRFRTLKLRRWRCWSPVASLQGIADSFDSEAVLTRQHVTFCSHALVRSFGKSQECVPYFLKLVV